MLFQELIGSIIGSIIATIGAIMVWVIIEFLKKYQEKRKLNKNIQLLYKEFAKEMLEPYMAITIKDLIREIGLGKFSKILKFDGGPGDRVFFFSNENFIIELSFQKGENRVGIRKTNTTDCYYYNEPDKYRAIRDSFLEYYKEQCKNSKIKIN